MGRVAAGQVVFLPFPFSDLSQSKRRPAVLLAYVGQGDWIACQITSNPFAESQAIELTQSEFQTGSLKRNSYLRPGKLFTANESLITATPGTLTFVALERIRDAVVAAIREVTL
jgi:mRNA interferase MazF